MAVRCGTAYHTVRAGLAAGFQVLGVESRFFFPAQENARGRPPVGP